MIPTITKRIMRDFSLAAETYDNYAILQRKVSDKLFAMFNSQIFPSENTANIMDIGCGTGYFHELLRKNKIYLPLAQTDIAYSMCRIAANYASPPEYGVTHTCTADMHNLPFADNYFSAIFSSMTMQWSFDLEQAFTESRRVLRKNGSFAFSIVGDGSLQELREAFLLAGHAPPIHNFARKADIEIQLAKAGLTIDDIHSETITMVYDDIYSLLRAIKNIGATYKGERHSGLRGKKYFIEIEKKYREKLAHSNGLPVSWNIIYAKGHK